MLSYHAPFIPFDDPRLYTVPTRWRTRSPRCPSGVSPAAPLSQEAAFDGQYNPQPSPGSVSTKAPHAASLAYRVTRICLVHSTQTERHTTCQLYGSQGPKAGVQPVAASSKDPKNSGRCGPKLSQKFLNVTRAFGIVLALQTRA